MIGKTISHYKILEQLGSGGMGIVYKAEDIKLKRIVALKFLPIELTRDSDAKTRFVREAQAASILQHTNICTIHEIDETADGQMYICMDFYNGETLKKKIEQAPLKIDQAIDFTIQIAQGLAVAHEAAEIHRDIKPANIMITERGEVKIVDFGLAKLIGQARLTVDGKTLGTIAYMSPQQARGEEVDQRTDIWSLGVVLYEMLTGKLPFKGDYEQAVIYSIVNEIPAPVTAIRTDIPLELERIVQKCLSKDPVERYQHMDELLVDLRSCMKSTEQAGTQIRRPVSPIRKRRRLFWYGAFAGLIGLTLVVYFLVPGKEKPTSQLKMIAVLPFENLGPAEDEYFADGLTEEIISRLSSISKLGVISRTSSIQYKKTSKTIPVVAKELGVDYILEGTIRWVKTGGSERIRITPQLIKASSDVHLWADNMDRTLDDIFRIQTEIATHVVDALGVVLKEGEQGTIDAIPTKNMEAYQVFLRGLASGPGYEKNNTKTAIEMFQRAVTLDTTFALAYCRLSSAHLLYYWEGSDRTSERLAAAKQALDKAFTLQPDLPEAYRVLSMYYYRGYRDYEKALETLKKAEKMVPNDSRVYATFAYIWRRQGKFEEAVEGLKKALKLDPQSYSLPREIGNTLYQLGKYPEAEIYFDRAISLHPDESLTYIMKSNMYLRWHGDTGKNRSILELVPTAYSPWKSFVELDIYERNYQAALDHLAKAPEQLFIGQHEIAPVTQLRGMIYYFMGDTIRSHAWFDTARILLESEITKRPDDYRLHISLGITLAGLGRKREAVQEAERTTELMSISNDAVTGIFPIIALAQVYTMVGMNDAALDKLDYLLSLHAPKYITPSLLRLDPIYNPLRGHPRFQTFLAKAE
jgi:serine/threonine protein kinase/tetratricopeptide (TPR) repeat protein